MFTLARVDEEVVAIIGIMMGAATIISVVATISYNRRCVKEAAYTAHLKDQMIQRGMSAEEIDRVISAKPMTQNEKILREAAKGVSGFWKQCGL